MPRITLSADEARELKVTDEVEVEVSVEEYDKRRWELFEQIPDGDLEAVKAWQQKYPDPHEIAEREKAGAERQKALEAAKERHPKGPDERAKMIAEIEAVPDGDKAALRTVLEKWGQLAPQEDGSFYDDREPLNLGAEAS